MGWKSQQSKLPLDTSPHQAVQSVTNANSHPVLARRLGHLIVSVELCSQDGRGERPMIEFRPPRECQFCDGSIGSP